MIIYHLVHPNFESLQKKKKKKDYYYWHISTHYL